MLPLETKRCTISALQTEDATFIFCLLKYLREKLLSYCEYYDFFPSMSSKYIRNVCEYIFVSINLIVMLHEYVCVEKKAMQRPALLASYILGR